MKPMSREQCGELLAVWLLKHGSPETAREVAHEAGYNVSPWFGAKKKRVRLPGELAIVNSALAISAVNEVFDVDDAKPIVDRFLDVARSSVFRTLEAADGTFKQRYEDRLPRYFEAQKGKKTVIGLSFEFMTNLDLDPVKKNIAGGFVIGLRIGRLFNGLVGFLQEVSSLPFADSGGGATAEESSNDRTTGFIGMMDVDDFDFINQTLGRDAGDQVMDAYKSLVASRTTTDVLSEKGFRAFEALIRGEHVPGGAVLEERLGDTDFVLCFPYDSGDEFIVHLTRRVPRDSDRGGQTRNARGSRWAHAATRSPHKAAIGPRFRAASAFGIQVLGRECR